MARKKKRRVTKRQNTGRPVLPWITLGLALIIVFQSLWLLAFIFSTHTLVPSNVRIWASGEPAEPWGPAREEELQRANEEADNLRLQKLLAEEGSRGPEKNEENQSPIP
ncbi:MAG: hypothetical protein ACOCVL_03675 [Candidatus Sumerlaeota bacterium]